MLYLLGVNLPDDKTVPIALTHIYGVGHHKSHQICHKLSIHPRCRLRDLPEDKVTKLSALLNTMKIDAELRRETRNNVNRMVQIGSYRGARHKAGLPVNGQRTRTNRSTAKKMNGRWIRHREFHSIALAMNAPRSSIPIPPGNWNGLLMNSLKSVLEMFSRVGRV